jgi:hypothetical protein
MAKVNKQELEWQAESDARMISEMAVIRNDKPRFARAVKQAQKLAKEEQQKADALQAVADNKWPMDYKQSQKEIVDAKT